MITEIQHVSVMSCPVHNLSMDETIQLIKYAIADKQQLHHVVVNAAKLINMRGDPQLRASVIGSDLINADGASVVMLSKLKGTPLKERVAGVDLMQELVEVANAEGWRIFLFGATQEVVSAVAERYALQYGKELIAGFRNGYYSPEEEPLIAEEIANSGAQLLFVAITSPKKENFLYKYRETLKNVNFIMGVGGTFDVIAGKTKRAPLCMQKMGLEWLYRIYQEPRRMWKRYLVTNTLFIAYSIPEIIDARLKQLRKAFSRSDP